MSCADSPLKERFSGGSDAAVLPGLRTLRSSQLRESQCRSAGQPISSRVSSSGFTLKGKAFQAAALSTMV